MNLSVCVCVRTIRYTLHYSWGKYAVVDVPSVPGSSGSPRLISCKVVPSCRNEGRFAQGPPPPRCLSLSLQIPDDPRWCRPRKMAFRYVELWPPLSCPPEVCAAKVKWAGHTRHVASDFMPLAPWDDGFPWYRGSCHLEIFRMPSTARHVLVNFAAMPLADSYGCLPCLPPVCASLDSSATV